MTIEISLTKYVCLAITAFALCAFSSLLEAEDVPNTYTRKGQLTKIEGTKVYLVNRGGGEKSGETNENTKYIIKGKEATLADLKPGMFAVFIIDTETKVFNSITVSDKAYKPNKWAKENEAKGLPGFPPLPPYLPE